MVTGCSEEEKGKGDLHYLLLSAEGGSGRFDLNFENFMGDDDDGGDLRSGGDEMEVAYRNAEGGV